MATLFRENDSDAHPSSEGLFHPAIEAQSPVPDLYALYKPWRNRLAELDRRESLYVIWAYSQAISAKDFAMPDDITVEPHLVGRPGWALNLWELEILAGEIILNAGEAARRQRSLRNPAQLLNIVQGLRALENEIYGANEGAADVLIEIWRISHRQFTWQQKRMTAAETIRYYMIYNDEVIDRICTERLGLSVYDVYFIDMLFLGRLPDELPASLPHRHGHSWPELGEDRQVVGVRVYRDGHARG